MTAFEFTSACLLDLVAGDPRWFPHPVRLMGRIVDRTDRLIHRLATTARAQRIAGAALALGLSTLAYATGWTLLDGVSGRSAAWHSIIAVVLAWTTIALRDLLDHARPVLRALERRDLTAARRAVARIVGRDTEHLNEEEVIRATIETLAESTSDGIVAPFFYLVLGGPPLALAYKAVNTLDSMVGHPDEDHRHVGWASAKLDDMLNWLPARLSGYLLVVGAGMCGLRPAQAWRVLRRDGHKHQSPNSGRPEAAMAGALGVQIGGANTYAGACIVRPTMGSPDLPLTTVRIREAMRLVMVTSCLAWVCAVLVLMMS